MKWISRDHETLVVEWKEEGWHLDDPTDWAVMLRCGRCHHIQLLDSCRQLPITGLGGNSAGSVFELSCIACRAVLANLDSTGGEFRPLLQLRSDGAFANPRSP